jgi:hypothetical protein
MKYVLALILCLIFTPAYADFEDDLQIYTTIEDKTYRVVVGTTIYTGTFYSLGNGELTGAFDVEWVEHLENGLKATHSDLLWYEVHEGLVHIGSSAYILSCDDQILIEYIEVTDYDIIEDCAGVTHIIPKTALKVRPQ